MVDQRGSNVVDGPFLWHSTRPVFSGGALATFASLVAQVVKKARPKLANSG